LSVDYESDLFFLNILESSDNVHEVVVMAREWDENNTSQA